MFGYCGRRLEERVGGEIVREGHRAEQRGAVTRDAIGGVAGRQEGPRGRARAELRRDRVGGAVLPEQVAVGDELGRGRTREPGDQTEYEDAATQRVVVMLRERTHGISLSRV
jgi:hypothetical protein